MAESKNCKQCNEQFTVEDEDLVFYKKISPTFNGKIYEIPSPESCYQCRVQNRMVWRNERSLYKRKCDKSQEEIVSMYPEDSPYKVYSQGNWWGDGWLGTDYAKEFDSSKPFFEQMADLSREVPKMALLNKEPENSDFINRALKNKDCYMSFDVCWSENVLHSRTVYNSKDIFDSIFCWENCENLYNCANCSNTNNSSFCVDCIDVSGSHYSYNLKGCRDCIFSSNLRNKQYYFENKPLSKAEFESKLLEFDFGSRSKRGECYEKFKDLMKGSVRVFSNITSCEDSTGDYLENCKNVKYSFGAKDSRDSKYILDSGWANSCYDFDFSGGPDGSELSLEIIGSGFPYHSAFLSASWSNKNSFYLIDCHNCSNCLGCVGLKREEYCILNKKYSKEEYDKKVAQIIEHMQNNDEWGKYFPPSMSDFGYNETVAADYFPLERDEAVDKGFKWAEKKDILTPNSNYLPPDHIKEVSEDIIRQILVCETTGRAYKIQPREFVFYKNNNIPIPTKHPDQRFKEIFTFRNPLILHHRQCMCEESGHDHEGRCPNEFETTYAPDRSEKVYCESCYQKSVI